MYYYSMPNHQNRIKSRREELNYSLDKLSELTGISKTTLHRYENKENASIRIDKLKLIADALRVTTGYLTGSESMYFSSDKLIILDTFLDELPLIYDYDRFEDMFYFCLNNENIDDETFFRPIKERNDTYVYKISPKDLNKISEELIDYAKYKLYKLFANAEQNGNISQPSQPSKTIKEFFDENQ